MISNLPSRNWVLCSLKNRSSLLCARLLLLVVPVVLAGANFHLISTRSGAAQGTETSKTTGTSYHNGYELWEGAQTRGQFGILLPFCFILLCSSQPNHSESLLHSTVNKKKRTAFCAWLQTARSAAGGCGTRSLAGLENSSGVGDCSEYVCTKSSCSKTILQSLLK
jgi:hypothetical protein